MGANSIGKNRKLRRISFHISDDDTSIWFNYWCACVCVSGCCYCWKMQEKSIFTATFRSCFFAYFNFFLLSGHMLHHYQCNLRVYVETFSFIDSCSSEKKIWIFEIENSASNKQKKNGEEKPSTVECKWIFFNSKLVSMQSNTRKLHANATTFSPFSVCVCAMYIRCYDDDDSSWADVFHSSLSFLHRLCFFLRLTHHHTRNGLTFEKGAASANLIFRRWNFYGLEISVEKSKTLSRLNLITLSTFDAMHRIALDFIGFDGIWWVATFIDVTENPATKAKSNLFFSSHHRTDKLCLDKNLLIPIRNDSRW